jgi:hypothetical protein
MFVFLTFVFSIAHSALLLVIEGEMSHRDKYFPSRCRSLSLPGCSYDC